jgi:hypothetical protein
MEVKKISKIHYKKAALFHNAGVVDKELYVSTYRILLLLKKKEIKAKLNSQ